MAFGGGGDWWSFSDSYQLIDIYVNLYNGTVSVAVCILSLKSCQVSYTFRQYYT